MIVTAIVFTVALILSIEPAYCPSGKLEESDINKVLEQINEKRVDIAKGNVEGLPEAKGMNKIDWDCHLEEEAIKSFDKLCTIDDYTKYTEGAQLVGLYEGYTVVKMVEDWLNRATGFTEDTADYEYNLESTQVTYNVVTTLKEYFNLIRASTTGIGCAQVDCSGNGKFMVNCITNQTQLKDTDTIYEIGSEDCKSEDCDSGKTCNSDGLCDVPAETTTTVAETTITTTTAVVTTVTTAPVTHPGELTNGTNQQCPDNVGMTDELRMHFLDTQNYRRSTLAKGQVQRPSGNYLPTGANILKLKLDCQLEKRAIEEVQDCPTSKKPDDMYGKNFDTFPSSTATSTYRDAIKKAVTNWWKIVRTENNGPGMQVTFRSNHVNQPVESYTQIGWAKTQYLGCAIAKCSSSYTVICLYDPKGNQVDQPLYQIGSTCAACPVGTKCEASLGLCA